MRGADMKIVSLRWLIAISIDRSTFPLSVAVLPVPLHSTTELTTPPWLATAVTTDLSAVFHLILRKSG
jgi:hypothetical protein